MARSGTCMPGAGAGNADAGGALAQTSSSKIEVERIVGIVASLRRAYTYGDAVFLAAGFGSILQPAASAARVANVLQARMPIVSRWCDPNDGFPLSEGVRRPFLRTRNRGCLLPLAGCRQRNLLGTGRPLCVAGKLAGQKLAVVSNRAVRQTWLAGTTETAAKLCRCASDECRDDNSRQVSDHGISREASELVRRDAACISELQRSR
jgi:hypothetical protein